MRRSLGEEWAAEASHPFLTDLQRTAWRASGGESHGYFSFLREGVQGPALEFRRNYADIGGIVRGHLASVKAKRQEQEQEDLL